MSHTTSDKEVLTRRDALKTLAAATGAVTLAGLPQNWQTPLVEVGALPVHAQISPCGPSGSLTATAVTSTMIEGQYADFDFSACTPNGFYVWGSASGDGASHSGDNIDPDPHINYETITIPAGQAVNGTYTLYLEHYEEGPITVTITITTEACTYTFDVTFTEDRSVATVTYPGGIVTQQNAPGFPECGNGEGLEAKTAKGKNK